MRVFVDEDTGPGVARALNAVGSCPVEWIGAGRPPPRQKGSRDEDWLPYVGDRFLVLSRNLSLVEAGAQRALVVQHKVGIVFLPQHVSAHELLRLVMRRWDWLLAVNDEPRPFAYKLNMSGRHRVLLHPEESG